MNKRSLSVNATYALIVVNALIWLVLGIIIAADVHPSLPVPQTLRMGMAFMSIAMAIVLLGLFIFTSRGKRIAYYLILVFFGVTSLLTIFDDVGYTDIIVLILNIIPIILLIKDRSFYLHKSKT